MVKPGDQKSLEKELEKVLKDKKLRKKLADAGYKTVMDVFAWNKVLKRVEKMYEEFNREHK